jgi:hypothetical protein
MIAAGAVGRQRPRSRSRPPQEVRESSRPHGNACRAVIRRSVLECRETLGTPVRRTEPKTPPAAQAAASQEGGIHAVKTAEAAGTEPSTGARRSFRWQKSVERIARLARRKVARPGGGTSESLAGGKLEAPPDAEHEPRKGETVLRKSAHPKVRA